LDTAFYSPIIFFWGGGGGLGSNDTIRFYTENGPFGGLRATYDDHHRQATSEYRVGTVARSSCDS